MSAFICSKLHIQTIAQNYVNIIGKGNVLKIANILYKENVKSVNYRYNEKTKLTSWRKLDKNIKPVSLIKLYKLVQCIDYQSCEHDSWTHSEAYQLLQELEAKIVPELEKYYGMCVNDFYKLPEYNNAKWSI